MNDIDVRIQWHSPDEMFAAVFVRDGEEWYLDGALVGMGPTPGLAVSDLLGLADHLVREGENFLTDGQIEGDDRMWLFKRLDRGNDDAAIHARYVAMRQAGFKP